MASADFTEKEDLEEIMKIQEVRVLYHLHLTWRFWKVKMIAAAIHLASDVLPPNGDDSSSQPEPEGIEEIPRPIPDQANDGSAWAKYRIQV